MVVEVVGILVGGAADASVVHSLPLSGDRSDEWAELKLGDSPVSPDLVDLLSISPHSPPSPSLVVSLSSRSLSLPWQPKLKAHNLS